MLKNQRYLFIRGLLHVLTVTVLIYLKIVYFYCAKKSVLELSPLLDSFNDIHWWNVVVLKTCKQNLTYESLESPILKFSFFFFFFPLFFYFKSLIPNTTIMPRFSCRSLVYQPAYFGLSGYSDRQCFLLLISLIENNEWDARFLAILMSDLIPGTISWWLFKIRLLYRGIFGRLHFKRMPKLLIICPHLMFGWICLSRIFLNLATNLWDFIYFLYYKIFSYFIISKKRCKYFWTPGFIF